MRFQGLIVICLALLALLGLAAPAPAQLFGGGSSFQRSVSTSFQRGGGASFQRDSNVSFQRGYSNNCYAPQAVFVQKQAAAVVVQKQVVAVAAIQVPVQQVVAVKTYAVAAPVYAAAIYAAPLYAPSCCGSGGASYQPPYATPQPVPPPFYGLPQPTPYGSNLERSMLELAAQQKQLAAQQEQILKQLAPKCRHRRSKEVRSAECLECGAGSVECGMNSAFRTPHSALGGGGAAVGVFVHDSFTGTDGTLLANHTGETGAAWTKVSNFTADAVLDTDRARTTTVPGLAFVASGVPGLADYTVEIVFTVVANRDATIGALARFDLGKGIGQDTYYHFGYRGLSAAGSGHWFLTRFINGAATSLGTFAESLAVSTSYTVTLVLTGSTLQLLVNGSAVFNVVDTTPITGAGRVGIHLGDAPDAAGYHLTALTATDNSLPEIVVTQEADVADNTGSVDFGATAAAVPVTRSFVVSNTGSGALLLSGLSTTGAAFSVATGFGMSSLAPGQMTIFALRFNPPSDGPHTGTVTFVTNDPSENPYNFALTGTGGAAPGYPEIQVVQGTEVLDNTGTVDFGTTTDPETLTFTVTNTGSGTLVLSGLATTGSAFAVAAGFGSTSLAPSASTTFVLQFTPPAPGVQTGTVTFVTNDPDENPFNFALTGTGAGEPAGDQEWTMAEHLGTNHFHQPVAFDIPPPGFADFSNRQLAIFLPPATYIEVPYQVLAGTQIMTRADLNAGQTLTWVLRNVGPRSLTPPANPVTIDSVSSSTYHEITNGLGGVRVRKVPVSLAATPCPVVGVQHRDGTWVTTGAGFTATYVGGLPSAIPVPDALTMTVQLGVVDLATGEFTESSNYGAFLTAVKVTYTFNRPERVEPGGTIPAGPGFYTCTIWMMAGFPVVMFEEHSDMDLSWHCSMATATMPTLARMYAHGLATSHVRGHRWDGSPAPGGSTGESLEELLIDIVYAADRDIWTASVYRDPNPPTAPNGTCTPMKNFDIHQPDAGVWVHFHDPAAAAAANVWGIFVGRTSRLIGNASTGTGWYNKATPDIGVVVMHNRFANDNTVAPENRWQWGLWLGRRDEIPANDALGVLGGNAVNNAYNMFGGWCLNKVYRYQGTHVDRTAGLGALYMPAAAAQSLITRVNTDLSYYNYLLPWYGGVSAQMIEYWRTPTVAGITGLYDAAVEEAHLQIHRLVHGRGISAFGFANNAGTSRMVQQIEVCEQVLLSTLATPAQKAHIRAVNEFFCELSHDNDCNPYQDLNDDGETPDIFGGFGNANQRTNFKADRNQLVFILSAEPKFAAAAVVAAGTDCIADFLAGTADDGSVLESPGGYYQNVLTPTLTVLTQAEQALPGTISGAVLTRLEKTALWCMSILTPDEPRFNVGRKTFAIGSGSYESPAPPGALGTALAYISPLLITPALTSLSLQCMGMWRRSAKAHTGGILTATLLRIDDDLPGDVADIIAAGTMTTRQFPHTLTFFQDAATFHTNNDTRCTFYAGNNRQGHANTGDRLAVLIYALRAPLMIDYGGFSTVGHAEYYHCTVLPEVGGNPGVVNQAWNADNPDYMGSATYSGIPGGFIAYWGVSILEGFNDATHPTRPHYAKAKVTVASGAGDFWRREFQYFPTNPLYPTFALQDTMRNAADTVDSTVFRVLTFPMMAASPVTTPPGTGSPVGQVTPIPRLWDELAYNAELPVEAASSGTPYGLATATVHNFRFLGQPWVQHHAGGIDWDLWFYSPSAAEFLIGNWAHNKASVFEKDSFLLANGYPFEERQHLLRFRGQAKTTVAITAYRKGLRPAGLTAAVVGTDLVVSHSGGTLATIPL